MKANANTSAKTNVKACDNASENPFQLLLDTFENEYRKDRTTDTYAKALTDLATAVTYSVLKKVIDPQRKTAMTSDHVSNSGLSPQLLDIKRSIYFDSKNLSNMIESGNNAFRLTVNADGDTIEEVDSYNSQTFYKLLNDTIGDGMDLVNTAVSAILEQCKKVDTSKPCFLLDIYEVTRLRKRVYIKEVDTVGGWETVDTTPIQEVFKAVNREVEKNRSIKADTVSKYSYIELSTYDKETGASDTCYKRLDKYADLGGNVVSSPYNTVENCVLNHINSTNGMYTADTQTADDMEHLIDMLELTERQAQILKLRLRGYGYEAIATYLGIKNPSVVNIIKSIQTKAINNLNLSTELISKLQETDSKAKKNKLSDSEKSNIKELYKRGHSMTYIAQLYNVGKMTVSRVINGRSDRKRK